MADLKHWQMWRQRCALALCNPEAGYDLRGFAYNRFLRYWRRYGGEDLGLPSAEQAWHGFESYLALGRRRSAKACKEWLFARGGGVTTLNQVQGGATLVMRDVVREQLRREHSPRWMQSLDKPLGAARANDGNGPTLADLIPEPHDCFADLERREFRSLAAAEAEAAFDALNRRERLALTASRAGLSLAHPAVVSAAGCSKSSLYNAFNSGLRKLADRVQRRFARESSSDRTEITILLFEQVHARLVAWLQMEKNDTHLFRIIEERS